MHAWKYSHLRRHLKHLRNKFSLAQWKLKLLLSMWLMKSFFSYALQEWKLIQLIFSASLPLLVECALVLDFIMQLQNVSASSLKVGQTFWIYDNGISSTSSECIANATFSPHHYHHFAFCDIWAIFHVDDGFAFLFYLILWDFKIVKSWKNIYLSHNYDWCSGALT